MLGLKLKHAKIGPRSRITSASYIIYIKLSQFLTQCGQNQSTAHPPVPDQSQHKTSSTKLHINNDHNHNQQWHQHCPLHHQAKVSHICRSKPDDDRCRWGQQTMRHHWKWTLLGGDAQQFGFGAGGGSEFGAGVTVGLELGVTVGLELGVTVGLELGVTVGCDWGVTRSFGWVAAWQWQRVVIGELWVAAADVRMLQWVLIVES